MKVILLIEVYEGHDQHEEFENFHQNPKQQNKLDTKKQIFKIKKKFKLTTSPNSINPNIEVHFINP